LKWIAERGWCKLDSNGCGYDPGRGSCEHGKVHLDTIKSGDKEEENFFRSSKNTSFSRKIFCHVMESNVSINPNI
jgi:hypothetical protein